MDKTLLAGVSYILHPLFQQIHVGLFFLQLGSYSAWRQSIEILGKDGRAHVASLYMRGCEDLRRRHVREVLFRNVLQVFFRIDDNDACTWIAKIQEGVLAWNPPSYTERHAKIFAIRNEVLNFLPCFSLPIWTPNPGVKHLTYCGFVRKGFAGFSIDAAQQFLPFRLNLILAQSL